MTSATFHGNHVPAIVHYLFCGPDKQRAGIYNFTLLQWGGNKIVELFLRAALAAGTETFACSMCYPSYIISLKKYKFQEIFNTMLCKMKLGSELL